MNRSSGHDETRTSDLPPLNVVSGSAASRAVFSSAAGSPPNGGSATGSAGSRELHQQRIGPYRVIRQLGSGGMGVVYLAVRDDDQLRTHVAIKLVKRGMDTDEIVARFELERRLLGALNHPNIARVLDAGVTLDGRPYFVVEHIDGRPLHEYCDNNRLRIDERLELFRTVCLAVHAAHQNLIVHRDLKPSNILVTAQGVPKLLDFGIAKLLNPQLSPVANDPTATELRLMTPQYASPEQVRGDPITTASDVYSLGVLLYELVTGHRPYQVRTRVRAEIERIICDEEPQRPSTAVTRIAEQTSLVERDDSKPTTHSVTPEIVSRTREGRPGQLRRRLAGDVDNIVLMAMRKEPQRRYASAEQFAQDIRRHLDGMPVIARGDSAVYRMGKFVRRHRASVVGAALVGLSLAGGLLATTTSLRAALAQRNLARLATSDALAQQELARQQTLQKQAMVDYLRAIGRFIVLDLSDSALPMTASARQQQLAQALRALDAIAATPVDDPATHLDLQRDVAAMYEAIGQLQGSPRAGNLGDTAGAIESCQAALAIRSALVDLSPHHVSLLREKALGALHLADLLQKNRDLNAAMALYASCVEQFQHLMADRGDDASRRPLAVALVKVGDNLFSRHDLDGAADRYQRSLALRQMLAERAHASPDDRLSLSTGLIRLADIDLERGRHLQAIARYEEALAIEMKVADQEPRNPRYRRLVALGHHWLSHALAQAVAAESIPPGRAVEAVEHSRQAAREMRRLHQDDPDDARLRSDLSLVWRGLGEALDVARQPIEAVEHHAAAIEMLETVVRDDPANVDAVERLAETHLQLGSILVFIESQQSDGVAHLQRAVTMFQSTLAGAPENERARRRMTIARALLQNHQPGG